MDTMSSQLKHGLESFLQASMEEMFKKFAPPPMTTVDQPKPTPPAPAAVQQPTPPPPAEPMEVQQPTQGFSFIPPPTLPTAKGKGARPKSTNTATTQPAASAPPTASQSVPAASKSPLQTLESQEYGTETGSS